MKQRILVTDDSEFIMAPLSKLLREAGYEVMTAKDGQQCLALILSFQPHLIILDLMLPKIHGLKILQSLKTNPVTEDVGVIIAAGRSELEDYEFAMEYGADQYLLKPLNFKHTLQIVQNFFKGTLTPNSFPTKRSADFEEEIYNPSILNLDNYIKFWGTRGSISVSGSEYTRWGGNTACLELRYDNTTVIIDAGNGIRGLGHALIATECKKIPLLIGHTHWDHISGFPFFAPAYHPDYQIDIYGPKGFWQHVKDSIEGMLERNYFPVRLEEMRAKVSFFDLSPTNSFQIGNIKIVTSYAMHPGETLCFKIILPHITIGYATDNEFLLGYHGHPNKIDLTSPRLETYQATVEFFKGCDLLIHEAQYTPEQYLSKVGWGHSSIANAAILIKLCDIKYWIITHHDPDDTDDHIQEKHMLTQIILQECNINCLVEFAFDGYTLPL